MKAWFYGDLVDIKIGMKVLVARCGSGHSYFGEFGKIVKYTENHIVIETESGAIVKTKMNNIGCTVGKAAKNGYSVSIKVDGREEDKNFFHENVRYWNERKLCLEYK